MNLLEDTLKEITGANQSVMEEVKLAWDKLAKPLGSLGTLEILTMRIAGMTGKLKNDVSKRAVLVLAGDNGVYEENIASSPKEFTVILVENTAKGITGVATLAKHVNSDVFVIDLGIDAKVTNDKVIDRKIAYGTNNFTKGPAMTREDCIKAIEVGIEIADDLFEEGYDMLGVGELGVANTTTSSAILSVLTGLDPEVTCGVGAGLTDSQLQNKIEVIRRGIKVNNPNPDDVIDVISKVGGYDIAGMCGVYLSSAKNRKPVVLDGFISSLAALCAVRLNSNVIDYIIPSHLSKEPAASEILKELGLEAMLNMEMRLGEGSGCPLAFQLIDIALFAESNMGTFDDLNIDSSILLDMRKK